MSASGGLSSRWRLPDSETKELLADAVECSNRRPRNCDSGSSPRRGRTRACQIGIEGPPSTGVTQVNVWFVEETILMCRIDTVSHQHAHGVFQASRVSTRENVKHVRVWTKERADILGRF